MALTVFADQEFQDRVLGDPAVLEAFPEFRPLAERAAARAAGGCSACAAREASTRRAQALNEAKLIVREMDPARRSALLARLGVADQLRYYMSEGGRTVKVTARR